jgi:hypothetical protein
VHNLFEHLACSDLALVQGGLSTCMELVATRRPFLSFPLERHFEQCIHVQNRLHNYCADCSVRLRELSPRASWPTGRCTRCMPRWPTSRWRPMAPQRAAQQILAVLENRSWATA